MLGITTIRPADVETTARGAAMLCAVGAGIHSSLAAAEAMLPLTTRFEPRANAAERAGRLAAWHELLASEVGTE
jgi:glycerol kinase